VKSAEFGQPQWSFGMATYGFLPDGRIICSYRESGRSRIAVLAERLQPLDLFRGDKNGPPARRFRTGKDPDQQKCGCGIFLPICGICERRPPPKFPVAMPMRPRRVQALIRSLLSGTRTCRRLAWCKLQKICGRSWASSCPFGYKHGELSTWS
jgi:hypothetical protein